MKPKILEEVKTDEDIFTKSQDERGCIIWRYTNVLFIPMDVPMDVLHGEVTTMDEWIDYVIKHRILELYL